MSVDAENIKSLVEIVGALFLIPAEVIGIIGIMYVLVKESTFAGLAVLILSVILTRFTGQKISSNGSKKSKETANRTNLLSEIINGVKAIKFFAWEEEFIRKITETRKREEKYLRFFFTDLFLYFFIYLFMNLFISFKISKQRQIN